MRTRARDASARHALVRVLPRARQVVYVFQYLMWPLATRAVRGALVVGGGCERVAGARNWLDDLWPTADVVVVNHGAHYESTAAFDRRSLSARRETRAARGVLGARSCRRRRRYARGGR